MRVDRATPADFAFWLTLAAEVEPIFGPMVRERAFHRALHKNIARGTAFCIRADDAGPGSPLLGGLLLSPRPPQYEIAWLAVAERARRNGVGSALLEHVLGQIPSPAEVALITFADGQDPCMGAARAFYSRFGFVPAEAGPHNPSGLPTQVFRRILGEHPTVRAVICRGSEVLLAQHHYKRPENLGKWSLPGGGIKIEDRDREAALRRELAEELGLAASIRRFIGVFADLRRIHYIYEVDGGDAVLDYDESEIAGLRWCTADDLAALERDGALLAPFVGQAVRAALQGASGY